MPFHAWAKGAGKRRESGKLSTLDPLPAPHEHVDFEHRDPVPVSLPNKINSKFSCPRIRHVLPLTMFGTYRVMNMMSKLVKKYVAEDYVS